MPWPPEAWARAASASASRTSSATPVGETKPGISAAPLSAESGAGRPRRRPGGRPSPGAGADSARGRRGGRGRTSRSPWRLLLLLGHRSSAPLLAQLAPPVLCPGAPGVPAHGTSRRAGVPFHAGAVPGLSRRRSWRRPHPRRCPLDAEGTAAEAAEAAKAAGAAEAAETPTEGVRVGRRAPPRRSRPARRSDPASDPRGPGCRCRPPCRP